MRSGFLILLLLPWICIFTGCKKEIDTIGLNLQDDDLLNAGFIQLPLQACSVLEDSIYTKNLLNNVVGDINDPVFGETKAGFCTQFDVAGSNTTLIDPDNMLHMIRLDSAILTLQYSGYFGDTTAPLHFEVYELTEALDRQNYYSSDVPSCNSADLLYSHSPFYPTPTSAVYIDSVRCAPHLRLRLSDRLGYKLLHMPASDLATSTAFHEAFRGLVVKAGSSGTGNLLYINLNSAMSGITLYYSLDGVSKKYTFPVSANCVRYNFFTHDYSTSSSEFRRQVINHDTVGEERELYVQPMAGVKTHLTMPAVMDSLYGHKIVINRAELVLTNISADASYFFPPYNLGLQLVKPDNTLTYLPDDAIYTSSDYFGGIYDANTKEYRFRITNYVQQLQLSGNQDQGVNIVIGGAGIRGNRLVMRGTDPSFSDRLRLEIYYTEY